MSIWNLRQTSERKHEVFISGTDLIYFPWFISSCIHFPTNDIASFFFTGKKKKIHCAHRPQGNRLFLHLLIYLFGEGGMLMWHDTWMEVRGQVFSSTMWIQGLNQVFRLDRKHLAHWAILPAQSQILKCLQEHFFFKNYYFYFMLSDTCMPVWGCQKPWNYSYR